MNLPQIVCKVVGHDWQINWSSFCDQCTRCGDIRAWKLNKIADAMASPLKTPLDYQSIGRKLITIEELPEDLDEEKS